MTALISRALLVVALTLLAFQSAQAQLLSESARKAIVERLEDVRRIIEANEDKMYSLAEEHDSLVTSRERWYAEMDRVQTEARNAAKELLQSKTKVEEMRKRVITLTSESKEQVAADEQLKTLVEKLKVFNDRHDRVKNDSTIKDRSRPTMLDSIKGEIIDTEIEIAQRRESLKISYLGGQAADLEKRLIELEGDMVVKSEVKKLYDDRLAQLKNLSPHVTSYLRLSRQVEDLQILHRKLADLNAQQQVEALKAIDAAKPKTVAALSDK